MDLNVTMELVDKHVKEGRGNKIAYYQLNSDGELIYSIRYSELLERVNRFGSALRNVIGLREEERVLIIMPDTIEAVIAFLGTVRMGGIAALINFKLTKDDYLYAANLIRARVLITDASHLNMALEIKQKVKSLWKIILTPAPGENHFTNDTRSMEEDVILFGDLIGKGSPEF